MDKANSTSVSSNGGASFIKLAALGAGLMLATTTASFAQSFDPEFGTGNVAYTVQWQGSVGPVGARAAAYYGTDEVFVARPVSELRTTRRIYRGAYRM